MNRLSAFSFLVMIALFPVAIHALSCTRPSQAYERPLCDPALQREFARLQRTVDAISRRDPRILWSQRAWMDRLRRDCAAGERWCIQAHVRQRMDELAGRIAATPTRLSSRAVPVNTSRGLDAPQPKHAQSTLAIRPVSRPRTPQPHPHSAAPRTLSVQPTATRHSAGSRYPIPGPPPAVDPRITHLLRNARYTIYDKVYRLQNGRYHNRAEWAYVDFGRILAAGDYDGDGKPEYLVSVYFNGGGSGIFPHFYLVSLHDGRPQPSLPYELPDRSDIRGAAIGKGLVTLATVEPGPNDPSCCPSVHRLHRLGLRGGKLVDLL